MQIPAAKVNLRILVLSIALGLIAPTLFGQDDSVPSAPSAQQAIEPKSDTVKNSEPTGDDAEKPAASAASAALDYLYNHKPQEGTAAKQASDVGQQMRVKAVAVDALGIERIEDPQKRARFEKYLALPATSQEQLSAYSADMAQAVTLLQQRKPFDAWKQLYKLSDYTSIDAGVSRELANRIESIWNADRASMGIAQRNDQLRNEIKGTSRNGDMLAESVREKEIEYQRKLSQNRDSKQRKDNRKENGQPQANDDNKPSGITAAPTIDAVIGKLQLTDAYLQTLEARAMIKLNELKTQKLFEEAKGNFSDYITTLFDSGRHRHVVLAADFYRRIFDASEYPVAMAQQVNLALEMARDVQSAVEVVQYKLDDNEVAAATSQLQQAFTANELHPALLGLDRKYKATVGKFYSALRRMQNLIEAREFTDLETLLSQMKETAPDFDSTKSRAIVNVVKLEGQLRLGKAKLAAQQGDLKQAMEEFQAAAEVWPSNPDLKDKALTFFDSQDIQSQSLREFDRLVEEGNYRGIFDNQLAFAPAMKDDKERQEHLKDALEKVKAAEMAIEKANLMRANGDVFGAWETVELAVTSLPNDNKLNTLRGELSGRSAEFVAAINRAKEAEACNEFGYSLTWYAIAQRHYPASRMANEAIERLSQQILLQQGISTISNPNSTQTDTNNKS